MSTRFLVPLALTLTLAAYAQKEKARALVVKRSEVIQQQRERMRQRLPQQG